jgi:hypothetical protein
MDNVRMSDHHISDGELIGFSDCEIGPARAVQIETHLKACAQCRARCSILSSGAQAYQQFHEEVLKPALAAPQSRWPDLRLAQAVSPRRNFFLRPAVWSAFALAAACLVLVFAYILNTAEPRRMSELLARASDAPAPVNRRIRVRVNGQSWSRPALLTRGRERVGLEHVEALFVRANYSWDNPLSAHSFALWRRHLSDKRDHVTFVDTGGRVNRLYRIQTETPNGTLHIASLTLRSQDLAAIEGAFEFDNHEVVTMSDAGQESTAPPNVLEAVPAVKKRLAQPVEHPVTAADELRVLAVLDQIGADVDEPLKVEADSGNQHIVISGMGMSAAREQQIRDALAAIPNAVVRFSSAQVPSARNVQSATPANPVGVDANPALRRLLEQRAGGAPQFEAITGQALDASNSLLARAHALAILAREFPPDVEANFEGTDRETLLRLRRKHAAFIEQTTLNLESALKPLLPASATGSDRYPETGVPPDASWQTGAAEMFERVRALDQSVTNLLGANYSSDVAQDVLNRLPKSLQQVEALARRQARTE